MHFSPKMTSLAARHATVNALLLFTATDYAILAQKRRRPKAFTVISMSTKFRPHTLFSFDFNQYYRQIVVTNIVNNAVFFCEFTGHGQVRSDCPK